MRQEDHKRPHVGRELLHIAQADRIGVRNLPRYIVGEQRLFKRAVPIEQRTAKFEARDRKIRSRYAEGTRACDDEGSGNSDYKPSTNVTYSFENATMSIVAFQPVPFCSPSK